MDQTATGEEIENLWKVSSSRSGRIRDEEEYEEGSPAAVQSVFRALNPSEAIVREPKT